MSVAPIFIKAKKFTTSENQSLKEPGKAHVK